MIPPDVLREIDRNTRGQFVRPLYGSYCLSNIPGAVLSLFGDKGQNNVLTDLSRIPLKGRKPKKVVLFLVDAFGYDQWLKNQAAVPFLRNFSRRGIVAPITTVFPSSTPVALTSLNTCLTPQEHGLVEWWMYLKEADRIVASLPFFAMDRKELDVDPKLLFDFKRPSLYQKLAKQGVRSYSFLKNAYSRSAYTLASHKGSTVIPFVTSSDLMVNLREKVAQASSPSFFYVYWDLVDTLAHIYGPHTGQHQAEINSFFYLLQKEFVEKVQAKNPEDVLLLITADHGQVVVEPSETVYLSKYKVVRDSLAVSRRGNKILPWGSHGVVFLQAKEGKVGSLRVFLERLLKGKAEVLGSEEAVSQGLFGRGKFHKKFWDRIGNLIILPYKDTTVWYEHIKGKKSHHLGHHGGMTRDEMLIPFAAANLKTLQY